MNQVRCSTVRYALTFLLGKSVLDDNVLPLDPTMVAQLLAERVQLNRATGSSTWIQVTDASDFPWLLRVSEGAESIEHRAKRIGKQLQFFTVACYLLLAAFYHLITLSALASSWVESPG